MKFSTVKAIELLPPVVLFTLLYINIYYLPAGRSVLRKTVSEVLSTARGRSPRAVLKTEGTVFLNTDRPRPANNIFIFSCCFSKVKRVLLFSESNVLQARVK